MIKRIFTFLLFSCSLFNSFAQDNRFEYKDSSLLNETGQTGTNKELDTSTPIVEEEKDILSDTILYITHIDISQDSVISWKNNKRFSYMKYIDSLLKIKKQEELDAYNEALNDKSVNFIRQLLSSGVMQFIFWAVAIAFVVFILYRLFLSNGIFKRKFAEVRVITTPEELKSATISDYDKLMHHSIDKADYRSAVRFLFLKTLVQLAEGEYIKQSADKTNYQYVQEIRTDMRNEFSSLVLNYEYVWYGNVTLNRELFDGIEKKFIAFKNKIE
jgi:hypothetical protein